MLSFLRAQKIVLPNIQSEGMWWNEWKNECNLLLRRMMSRNESLFLDSKDILRVIDMLFFVVAMCFVLFFFPFFLFLSLIRSLCLWISSHASDIVDMNIHAVLALIWCLIRRFQMSGSNSSGQSTSDDEVRNMLIQFVSEVCWHNCRCCAVSDVMWCENVSLFIL
jgi:hypothetical protein